MSNKNNGMQNIYDGLQDAEMSKQEAQLVETINNILKHFSF